MDITLEQINRVYEQFEDMLEPASVEEFAVAIGQLFRFGRAFGLTSSPAAPAKQEKEDPAAIAVEFYRHALGELPADVLMETIHNACSSWKWGNRLPLPADLREQIPERWHESLKQMRRLMAAMRNRP